MAIRWLAVLIAGCGRIGFEESPLAGADGSVDAIDATACVAATDHDEDGDEIADSCDVCPHVADAPQQDSDGDRVGDACDPRPSTPGDAIVRFHAFTEAPADWTLFSPTTFDGESLVIDSRDGSTWAASYPQVPRTDTLIVGGALGSRGTAAQQIVALMAFEGPGKYYCEVLDQAGTTRHQITETLDGTTFSGQDTKLIGTVENVAFTMAMARTPPTLRCASELGGAFVQSSGAIPTEIAPDQIAINIIDRAAVLDYFVQIRSD